MREVTNVLTQAKTGETAQESAGPWMDHWTDQSASGREVSVLFEKPGRLPGQMIGKSDYLHAVHVRTDARPGEIEKGS